MRYIKFSLVALVLLSIIFPLSTFAYVSLITQSEDQSKAYILIQATTEVPDDWKMDWIISFRNSTGYLLPMGTLKDHFAADRKLFLKVPPGEYQIEIAMRSDSWTKKERGSFDSASGKWIPIVRELIHISEKRVDALKDETVVLTITYRNPTVYSTQSERGETIILHRWENLKLNKSEKSSEVIPSGDPEIYPLTKNTSFSHIGIEQLVAALIESETSPAAGALLRAEEIELGHLIEALEDKSLHISGVVPHLLAYAGDRKATPILLEILAKGPFKHNAAWVLGELQDPDATSALIDALTHDSVIVRNYACYALARIGDQRAVNALTKALNDHSAIRGDVIYYSETTFFISYIVDWSEGIMGQLLPIPYLSVRLNAMYALGQIQDEKSLDSIIEHFDDSEPQMRFAAIFASGNFDSEKSRHALTDMLQPIHTQIDRYIAVSMLERIGNAEVLLPLVKTAEEDADEMVRKAAQRAIKKIQSKDTSH